jgi:hypothetical protein
MASAMDMLGSSVDCLRNTGRMRRTCDPLIAREATYKGYYLRQQKIVRLAVPPLV